MTFFLFFLCFNMKIYILQFDLGWDKHSNYISKTCSFHLCFTIMTALPETFKMSTIQFLCLLLSILMVPNDAFGCSGNKYKKRARRPSIATNPFRNGQFPLHSVPINPNFISLPREVRLQQYIYLHCINGDQCNLSNKNIDTYDLQQITFPSNIKIIDLSMNRIRFVDNNVLFPPSLTELYLSDNKLSTEQTIDLSHLSELNRVALDGNNLKSMHKIQLPPNITHFNFERNELSSFNDFDLSNLASLWYLDLSHNKIHELKGDISEKLPDGLKILFLDNNRISEIEQVKIPDELQLLNLSKNALTTRNIDIMNKNNYKNLRIDISANPLTELNLFEAERVIASPIRYRPGTPLNINEQSAKPGMDGTMEAVSFLSRTIPSRTAGSPLHHQ